MSSATVKGFLVCWADVNGETVRVTTEVRNSDQTNFMSLPAFVVNSTGLAWSLISSRSRPEAFLVHASVCIARPWQDQDLHSLVARSGTSQHWCLGKPCALWDLRYRARCCLTKLDRPVS